MSGLGDSPAYPEALAGTEGVFLSGGAVGRYRPGMTYRQWVAGKVLAGFASDPECQSPEGAAADAVRWADALIAALEGTPASSGEPAAKPEPKPARAVDVECPTCHAAPGTGCGYADGEPFAPGRVHPYRAVAFAAAYEPDDVPPKPAKP